MRDDKEEIEWRITGLPAALIMGFLLACAVIGFFDILGAIFL